MFWLELILVGFASWDGQLIGHIVRNELLLVYRQESVT